MQAEAAPEGGDFDPPPLPGGWPLDANLRPPDLPGTRDGADPPEPQDAPTPVVATPAPVETLKPVPNPVFAAPRAMLRGHVPGPTVEPLLSAAEVRWFAIAIGVALSMIACGTGGLIGMTMVLKGYFSSG